MIARGSQGKQILTILSFIYLFYSKIPDVVDFYSFKYMPSIFNLYWDMGLTFSSRVKNKNVHCDLDCGLLA